MVVRLEEYITYKISKIPIKISMNVDPLLAIKYCLFIRLINKLIIRSFNLILRIILIGIKSYL